MHLKSLIYRQKCSRKIHLLAPLSFVFMIFKAAQLTGFTFHNNLRPEHACVSMQRFTFIIQYSVLSI